MFFDTQPKAYLRRNRRTAKPTAPKAKIAIEVGSGTAADVSRLQATLIDPPSLREKAICKVAPLIEVESPS